MTSRSPARLSSCFAGDEAGRDAVAGLPFGARPWCVRNSTRASASCRSPVRPQLLPLNGLRSARERMRIRMGVPVRPKSRR